MPVNFDDPKGPVMTEEYLNNLIELPMFQEQAELMRIPFFRKEMASMLEVFKELRKEEGDGTEGASQRMDNFEFMITSLMKKGEEDSLDEFF